MTAFYSFRLIFLTFFSETNSNPELYNINAAPAPKKLNNTGVHLTITGINSASNTFKCAGKINIAEPKKSVPGPIIASLNKYPANILPNANITKGVDMFHGDSCAFKICP
jgi:hypothetical protein